MPTSALDSFTPCLVRSCTMPESTSLKRLIILTVGILPIVNAVGCPYNAGNEALKPRSLQHPEERLEPRYHQGSNLGRCSQKSQYAGGGTRSSDWWPCELSLAVLRQNGIESNPLGVNFDYAKEFAKIDCKC